MTTAAAQPTQAVRTLVVAPGAQLDDDIAYALTELRDRQESRLLAQQRTEMALRHATRVTPPPPDESTVTPPPVDVSELPALVEWPDVGPFGEVQSPTDAPPSGEFRPVHTELRSEGGLVAVNLSDGTHLYGRRKHNGDDLIRFSVGATSHFELRPENIPNSPTGRYRSAPPADAHGQVFGLTGHYLPVLFADDKWCHCFRILRHSLWQLVNGQWRALGERRHVETLIHLENVVQVGTKTVDLSGFMPSPVLDFGIVDRNVSVWAQVEIRFDVDLEGDALITFSPEPNPSNSVVVRTFGWWARAI